VSKGPWQDLEKAACTTARNRAAEPGAAGGSCGSERKAREKREKRKRKAREKQEKSERKAREKREKSGPWRGLPAGSRRLLHLPANPCCAPTPRRLLRIRFKFSADVLLIRV